jgi:hypothetical protein
MSSHVGTTSVGSFLQVKDVIAEELEGQTREASQILTFPLSKARPGACRSYVTRGSLYNLYLQMYYVLTYRI